MDHLLEVPSSYLSVMTSYRKYYFRILGKLNDGNKREEHLNELEQFLDETKSMIDEKRNAVN